MTRRLRGVFAWRLDLTGRKEVAALDELLELPPVDPYVNGWASAHRIEERAYLQAVSAPEHVHVDPVPGCAQCFEVFR